MSINLGAGFFTHYLILSKVQNKSLIHAIHQKPKAHNSVFGLP
jgi:hypothetical protein